MKIEVIKVGYLETNCYVISNNGKCLVIDPGDEYLKIAKIIGKYDVEGVIITHYHFDHIGALEELVREKKVNVYDYSNLGEGLNKIGDFIFYMIKTPGHKEDLISIYFDKEKCMFVGDFIFKNSIGRCDLDGGDFSLMMKSIDKIKRYPSDTVVYPGHGPSTTIMDEINNNVYFN